MLVCLETQSGVPGGREVHVEEHHGAPIYALVHADDATEACSKARNVVDGAHPRHVGDPSSEPMKR